MESVPVTAGAKVRFALGEAICPGFDELCRQIDSELEIEGEVVFLSDYGNLRKHFVIVQVKGIHVPLIVPAEKVKASLSSHHEVKGLPDNKDKLVG